MRWPLVVALVAVVAFAASATTVGAERLLTGADIKDGSITGRDIKPGSLESEHLVRKHRNHAYVAHASSRAGRAATVWTTDGKQVNLISVSVPAGQYVIQASLTATLMTVNSYVNCTFTDSANVLTGHSPVVTWLNQVNAQTWIPMAVVASATYTGQTTIYLTCSSQFASAGLSSASLVAEQVSLVTSQRS
ncbi:MAG: hypothetical protein ACKO2Y_03135 [Actinomycetota bacterium]